MKYFKERTNDLKICAFDLGPKQSDMYVNTYKEIYRYYGDIFGRDCQTTTAGMTPIFSNIHQNQSFCARTYYTRRLKPKLHISKRGNFSFPSKSLRKVSSIMRLIWVRSIPSLGVNIVIFSKIICRSKPCLKRHIVTRTPKHI